MRKKNSEIYVTYAVHLNCYEIAAICNALTLAAQEYDDKANFLADEGWADEHRELMHRFMDKAEKARVLMARLERNERMQWLVGRN
jgi:hypothetical protein